MILPRNSHFEDFEVEHVLPDGDERTMLLNAHRVVQAAEKPEQLILLAIEDITVRKRAERLRQETEDRLRTMVDTAVDAIITIDERGIINSINAATERMFGYPSHELIGKNVKMLMPGPLPRSARRLPGRLSADRREAHHRARPRGSRPPQGRHDVPGGPGGQRVRRPGPAACSPASCATSAPARPWSGRCSRWRPWNSNASARNCTTPRPRS